MRRRWLYTSGGNPLPGPVEVSEDFTGREAPTNAGIMTDRWMEGTKAPDGTDIGSRWKRREYMTRAGVADAGDYTQHWQKAAERKAEYVQGRSAPDKELRETVGRAAYELKHQRGRKR